VSRRALADQAVQQLTDEYPGLPAPVIIRTVMECHLHAAAGGDEPELASVLHAARQQLDGAGPASRLPGAGHDR